MSIVFRTVNLAVESGGFSFAGGYILPDGSFGDLRDKIQIYQKDGNKCPSCEKKVIKEFMGGRATFFVIRVKGNV